MKAYSNCQAQQETPGEDKGLPLGTEKYRRRSFPYKDHDSCKTFFKTGSRNIVTYVSLKAETCDGNIYTKAKKYIRHEMLAFRTKLAKVSTSVNRMSIIISMK